MSPRKLSRGLCAYCGAEIVKHSAAKHLAGCPDRLTRIAAERKTGPREQLFHLRVQAADHPAFWLDLEMRGAGRLLQLDAYLRHIWLECCGHLSRFSLGGWRGQEISKTQPIQAVFQPGLELTHIYDYGTSSETLIKAVAVRAGRPLGRHPVALMARNRPPDDPCMECEQRAGWLCLECVIEWDTWGVLCDQHARTHPHDAYGEPVALVNSPRLGLCGYVGPAEPPY